MTIVFDKQLDELLARGGSFDITGTDAVVNKQFWGFNASDGAVVAAIKGLPLKTVVTTLAGIRAAEVDISTLFLTTVSDPLFAGVIYRVDGYVITSVDLTSGSLHAYKTNTQITA
jgi:hypothetical protein